MSILCEILLCNNHEGSIPSSRTKYLAHSYLRQKTVENKRHLQHFLTTKSPKKFRTLSSIPLFRRARGSPVFVLGGR